MIEKAVVFATRVHRGTMRKGTNQPYIFHPLEVLSLVTLMTSDEDIMCAAVLHDTLEDTDTTWQELKLEFNERIADLVSAESEDKRGQINKEGTWIERKQEAIDQIRSDQDKGSLMICLADKVSNLRSYHLGLLEKGENFWDLFNMKDPLKHYWYYNELKDALSSLKHYSVYKEYCFLINTVFDRYLKGENDEECL